MPIRFLIALLFAFTVAAPAFAADAPQRPNILWLSYEDSSPHLGCYGDPHARTPNIDAFAKQAVRYTHAFTVAGVCAPSRSGIITGMYPTTIGSHHMRSQATLPPHIKTFPTYLREAGYYCSNNVKTDYNLTAASHKGTWDESSNKAHYKSRKEGQPFFAVFNFTQSHESQFHGPPGAGRQFPNAPEIDPATLTLPPYYPGTPAIRADWAQNYRSIAQVDFLIGQKLKELEDSGLADDTIVFVWSDHGDGVPRAKRWLYDSGTRVPLLVRIPEKFRVDKQATPGSVDDQLVSGIDLGPTVLNLSGVKVPEHMQGRAFLGANLTKPREYVYGARDRMDERYDMIRSVRDKRYRYIRNYMPWVPYSQHLNYNEQGNIAKEWRRLHDEGELEGPAKAWFAERKPAEELYDLEKDPHEVTNLAKSPDHEETLKRMRTAHEKWQTETRDIGFLPESIMNEQAKAHGSHHAILWSDDFDMKTYALCRSIAAISIDTKAESITAFNALAKTAIANGILMGDPVIQSWYLFVLADTLKWSQPPGNAGRMFEPSLKKTSPAGTENHESPRLAAARGAAINGKPELALPVLIEFLTHKDEHIRLNAALALDEMGDAAKPAIDALKEAKKADKTGGKYVARVATHALNRMLGTKDGLE